MTNVYVGKCFNRFVRGQIKKDILKRVIYNGSTGSSWLFNQFNKLQIFVTDKTSFSNLFSSWYFFSQTTKKTDFSHFEAAEENQVLNFSGKEQTKDEMDFIDDSVQMREGVSFYRNVDLSNIDNYNKFPNQTRDPRSAVYEDNEMFFDVEDT